MSASIASTADPAYSMTWPAPPSAPMTEIIANAASLAVTPEGIYTKSLKHKEIPWQDLQVLKLRFFGTRRQVKNSSGGFMQLTLNGSRDKMQFESSIEGFSDIAWHAARALRQNNQSVDPTTAGNLLTLGVHPDEDTPRPVPET